MPKATTPGYQQLIDTVIRQLVAHIQGSQFSYKGKRYTLASSTLLQAIEAKCRELMAEVELTAGELDLLTGSGGRERDDLAGLIVAHLDLVTADGSLPADVKPTGLAGLFFNAMAYNAHLDVARIKPFSADQRIVTDGGVATKDTLKLSPRVKDVAHFIHQAIAATMTLPEAQALLVTLSTDVTHSAAQQLRVVYGARTLQAPGALFMSYLKSSQPATTGNTKTWQSTVLTIFSQIYKKYTEALKAVKQEHNLAVRAPMLEHLQQSGSALIQLLEKQMPGQEDPSFAKNCVDLRAKLASLFTVDGQQVAPAVYSNECQQLLGRLQQVQQRYQQIKEFQQRFIQQHSSGSPVELQQHLQHLRYLEQLLKSQQSASAPADLLMQLQQIQLSQQLQQIQALQQEIEQKLQQENPQQNRRERRQQERVASKSLSAGERLQVEQQLKQLQELQRLEPQYQQELQQLQQAIEQLQQRSIAATARNDDDDGDDIGCATSATLPSPTR